MTLLSIAVDFAKIALAILSQQSVDIIFAGDAMQHQGQIEAARTSDGRYDYTECFRRISPVIKEADYAVVNLETPLGGAPYRGYPCFSAPDSYAEALRDAGFDFMLTANNHMLDRGQDKGLRRTLTVLDSLGIPHVGTYRDAEQRLETLPKVVDVKGFKIGFLNYTYGTNGISVKDGAVVDYIDRQQIARDIKLTREAGAEVVCVAVHWGVEYQLLPHVEQKSLAKFLKEQGVDIIFGGHPHVIQPMELEVNPVTGRNTALIYSLGNFISNMKTRDTRGGAISKITLRRDSAGQAYVDRLAYNLIFVTPPTSNTRNFEVTLADDSVSPSWQSQRDAFVSSATNVFNRHNVNTSAWYDDKLREK